MKNINQFFAQILQLPSEWEVYEVNFTETCPKRTVHIRIRYIATAGVCKETGELYHVFDFRAERQWRHLNLMGCQTLLYCCVPRIKNSEGKIISVSVPWADDDERHTHMFENYAIRVLKATHNQTQAGDLLGVSYEKMNRIMSNAVERGLKRRKLSEDEIPYIGIDKKSYLKGHHYATIISDSKGSRILEVGEERTCEATEQLLEKTFTVEQLRTMKAVCVDMWGPYMKAIKKNVRMLIWYMTNFMWLNISTKALIIPVRKR